MLRNFTGKKLPDTVFTLTGTLNFTWHGYPYWNYTSRGCCVLYQFFGVVTSSTEKFRCNSTCNILVGKGFIHNILHVLDDLGWNWYFMARFLFSDGTSTGLGYKYLKIPRNWFICYFRKGKKMCRSELVKQDKYFNLFAEVGHEKYLDESTLKDTYVCKNVCMFFIWIPPIGFSEWST